MNREEDRMDHKKSFCGKQLWSGDVHAKGGQALTAPTYSHRSWSLALAGATISQPPQQAFNWIADVLRSTEEIKARGQVIVGLLHQQMGTSASSFQARWRERTHADRVGSQIPSSFASRIVWNGNQRSEARQWQVEYEVQFVERRLEEVPAAAKSV